MADASINKPKLRIGGAGFVELHDLQAKKYLSVSHMVWIREYVALSTLYMFQHSNIIKMIESKFCMKQNPETKFTGVHLEISLPRYPVMLCEVNIESDTATVQVILDIVSAVRLCHKVGVVHRDIKHANVLITKVNEKIRAILIDFSHAYTDLTVPLYDSDLSDRKYKLTHFDVATHCHRAPEVFGCEHGDYDFYTEKIDIWSIGVILFFMVCKTQFISVFDDNKTDVHTFMKAVLYDGDEKDYLTKMQTAYNKWKQEQLKYTDVYLSWITKMLRKEANDRVGASEIYNEIVEFAAKAGLKVVETETIVPHAPNVETIEKALTVEQQILLKRIEIRVMLYNINNNIYFRFEDAKKLFKRLIIDEFIRDDNMTSVVAAVGLILDTIISDSVCTVDYITEVTRKLLSDVDKNLTNHNVLTYYLTNFTQKYNIDFMINRKFTRA